MNPKDLYDSFVKNKEHFYSYINSIKKTSPCDIFTVSNPTLTSNPYTTSFPLNFFLKNRPKENKFAVFVKSLILYYIKAIYFLISYCIAVCIFKIYSKKYSEDINIIIDIFGLVDKTNKDGFFSENYLAGIYDIFERFSVKYSIVLRPYNVLKNPFKLKKFFEVINNDGRNFLFEYQFFSIKNFFELVFILVVYPFKALRVLRKEHCLEDEIFNFSLVENISNFNFDAFSRYIFGKNIAKLKIDKIYSWCEFQVIDRAFNYAVRTTNPTIKIIGLQPFINYEVYFNSFVDDLDYDMCSSPHEVFVNGKYYIRGTKKILHKLGASLRYEHVFKFKGVKSDDYVLFLGSYFIKETQNIIGYLRNFKDDIIFKKHPATNLESIGALPDNIRVVDDNVYKLFERAKILICSATGSALEAVACGVSVIIIASSDNFTANPLVERGKGEIWDIVYEKSEFNNIYKNIINFRKNRSRIDELSKFYRDNFFIEPSEDKIIEIFEVV